MAPRKPKKPSQPTPSKPAGPDLPPLDRALHAITLFGVFAGLAMPVIFWPQLVVFPFIFLKLIFFQIVLGLTLPAWIVLAIRQPRFRPTRSLVMITLGIHYAVLTLATIVAYDRHRSFWGNEERMNGLFTLLHVLAWFFMTVSTVRTWPEWRNLLRWQAAIGAVLTVAVIWQRFDLNLLGFPADKRVSGLLGNPIFSGTWHMLFVYILGLLWLDAKQTGKRVLTVMAVLSFVAVFLAGSRGPVVGFGIGLLVTAATIAVQHKHAKLIIGAAAVAVLALGGYLFVLKVLVPAPSLAGFWKAHPEVGHLFLADFDPARRHLWGAAYKGFEERPILGWGLASFEIIFDKHYDPWFLCRGVAETIHDSSHSLVFDNLSGDGILGFVSFVALWVSVYVSIIRAGRAGKWPKLYVALALGFCTSYLAQGLFVFDSPAVLLLIMFWWAFVSARPAIESVPDETILPIETTPRLGERPSFGALAALGVLALLLIHWGTLRPAFASNEMRQVDRSYSHGDCDGMLEHARNALDYGSPYVEDQLFSITHYVGELADRDQLNLCPRWPELLEQARKVEAFHDSVHPGNVRQREMLPALLVKLGRAAKDPKLFAEARPLIDLMLKESPDRQQYHLELASWFYEQGQVADAQREIEAAVAVDPDVGMPKWKLGLFKWRSLGQAAEGAAQMADAATKGCPYELNSSVDVMQAAQAYAVAGRREAAPSLVANVEALSPSDRPPLLFLAVASQLEHFQYLAERDRVLAMLTAQYPRFLGWLEPLRAGRVHSLDELQRLQPAPLNPN
ncbi:MAG: O-antigen ligase family protein [Deltaproteobacteria bacterium]|nr:O-antigen ligase family protein [Deltaproteobacteria bacterium]